MLMLAPTIYLPPGSGPLPRRASIRRGLLAVLILGPVLLLLGCGQGYRQPTLFDPSQLSSGTDTRDTLKAHMRSGELYILGSWALTDSGRVVVGSGHRYDVWRNSTAVDTTRIPTIDVALFESNSRQAAYNFGMFGMGVMTTAGAFISVVCLMDPKGCFGSCPTFYVEGEDTSRVHAEGFSSSVARVLEARDVDALDVTPANRRIAIRMRNEAQETHLVRRVALLAVPQPPGGRVFASGDSLFYSATSITPPSRCAAPDGDCRAVFAARDGRERLSLTDSSDLSARETIDLRFEGDFRHPGIVVTARNSLVSTFIFYQTLAYFGTGAGGALAAMERGTRAQAEAQFGMAQRLGGLEVQIRRGEDWVTIGSYQEHGPIASDTKVIPLPIGTVRGAVDVRLRAAKGNWRIDRVALADLGEPVKPTRIFATTVERYGRSHERALRSLRDSSDHLVTLPGDEYRLVFELPRGDQELFLESEGYYYEWMRNEWLADENPAIAAALVLDPAWGLRHLARPYKSREATMEKLFWASRFNVRNNETQPR